MYVYIFPFSRSNFEKIEARYEILIVVQAVAAVPDVPIFFIGLQAPASSTAFTWTDDTPVSLILYTVNPVIESPSPSVSALY